MLIAVSWLQPLKLAVESCRGTDPSLTADELLKLLLVPVHRFQPTTTSCRRCWQPQLRCCCCSSTRSGGITSLGIGDAVVDASTGG